MTSTLTRRALLAAAGAMALAGCRSEEGTTTEPSPPRSTLGSSDVIRPTVVTDLDPKRQIIQVEGQTFVRYGGFDDPRLEVLHLGRARPAYRAAVADLSVPDGTRMTGYLRTVGSHEPLLICTVGGEDTRLVAAYDAFTGERRWVLDLESDEVRGTRRRPALFHVEGNDHQVVMTISHVDDQPGGRHPRVVAVKANDGSVIWTRDGHSVVALLRRAAVLVPGEGAPTSPDATVRDLRLVDPRTGDGVGPDVEGFDGQIDLADGSTTSDLLRTSKRALDLLTKRWEDCPFDFDVVGRDGAERPLFAGLSAAGALITHIPGQRRTRRVRPATVGAGAKLLRVHRGRMWIERSDGSRVVVDRDGAPEGELPSGELRWWSDDAVSFGPKLYKVHWTLPPE